MCGFFLYLFCTCPHEYSATNEQIFLKNMSKDDHKFYLVEASSAKNNKNLYQPPKLLEMFQKLQFSKSANLYNFFNLKLTQLFIKSSTNGILHNMLFNFRYI